MSTTRAIWNDGQSLATPDLQRPCDVAGGADDRAHEILLTPGSAQKKVVPLSEETVSGSLQVTGGAVNPRILCYPSNAAQTPAGVTGAVRVLPAAFVAGLAANTQQVSLAGTTYAPLDSIAITSNSSGSIRYDLVYATLTRSVTVSGTRKIKSVTDGSVSPQVVNLADAPTITLAINPGFLTGATAPTAAQILAALPSDTLTAFSFPLCYVQVANGYTSGTALFQNSAGGSTFIVQAWPGGWVQPQRVHGLKPVSLFSAGLSESSVLKFTERLGSDLRFFGLMTMLSATSQNPGIVLDHSIDWRNRLIWGKAFYIGSGTTDLTTAMSSVVFFVDFFRLTGPGEAGAFTGANYVYQTGGEFLIGADTSGNLRIQRGAAGPIDGTNGDSIGFVIFASDRLNGV